MKNPFTFTFTFIKSLFSRKDDQVVTADDQVVTPDESATPVVERNDGAETASFTDESSDHADFESSNNFNSLLEKAGERIKAAWRKGVGGMAAFVRSSKESVKRHPVKVSAIAVSAALVAGVILTFLDPLHIIPFNSTDLLVGFFQNPEFWFGFGMLATALTVVGLLTFVLVKSLSKSNENREGLQLKAAEELVSKHDHTITQLLEQLNYTKGKLDKFKQKVAESEQSQKIQTELSEENETLRARLKDKQDRLLELTTEMKQLSVTNNGLNLENATLNRDNATLKSENATLLKSLDKALTDKNAPALAASSLDAIAPPALLSSTPPAQEAAEPAVPQHLPEKLTTPSVLPEVADTVRNKPN